MLIIIMTLFGLRLGSFFNVLVSREDWHKGRSRCDSCGYILKWYDIIPIVSYLILKGKCRNCHRKIAVEHLASEIFLGCGFAVATWYLGYDIFTAVIVFVAVMFLGICAISDMQSNEVSVLYLYGGILCLAVLKLIQYLKYHNIAGLFAFTVTSVALYTVFYFLAKYSEDKIGSGDFDILIMLYLVFGVFDWIACITITSVLGVCLYTPLVIRGKYDRAKPLPLAPLIYVAFIINLIIRGGFLV